MELKTAIEILDYHQEWRLGKRDDMIHTPKKLTEALDIVLSEVKKLTIPVVDSRRELLIAFLTDNIHGNLYFTKEVATKAVDEYLSN